MNTDLENALIRDLESPKAVPKSLAEDEVRISEELAKEILKKRGHATCRNCGKEMNAGVTGATTGLCVKCGGSSKVVEVQPNGAYKLVKRQERRTSRKAKRVARRTKR